MATAELDVYLLKHHVGTLKKSAGKLSFRYLPEYVNQSNVPPLSATLPCQQQDFDHTATEPFFSGLLPDSPVRDKLARMLNISAGNTFALLEAIGGECAGAVSLHKKGASPQAYNESTYRVLTTKEAVDVFSHLSARPLLAGQDGIRISGAGAQDKLMISFVKGHIAIPTGNTPSTHIIKPAIKEVAESVHNEFFCMTLAKEVGLPTAQADIYSLAGTPYYLTKRYDRLTPEKGGTTRLHQEDFCQAMGIPPDQKYQKEGGPSLKDCFNLLDGFIHKGHMPGVSKLTLLRGVLFNHLIGNGDAHGKNFSLLYKDEGAFLAPFYDLLCTVVYSNLYKDKMAMKIGAKYRFRDIQLRHFEALAVEIGIKPSFLEKELKQLARILPEKAEALAQKLQQHESYKAAIYKDILGIIWHHCHHFR